MKKLIAMVVLVILVVGMIVTAQAELRFKNFRSIDHTKGSESVTQWLVTIVSDSGDEQEIELTYEEWWDLSQKWAWIDAKQDETIRFANRNWYENIVPTLTFWNVYD